MFGALGNSCVMFHVIFLTITPVTISAALSTFSFLSVIFIFLVPVKRSKILRYNLRM